MPWLQGTARLIELQRRPCLARRIPELKRPSRRFVPDVVVERQLAYARVMHQRPLRPSPSGSWSGRPFSVAVVCSAAGQWVATVFGRAPRGRLPSYCAKAFVVTLVPALTIAGLVVLVSHHFDPSHAWPRPPDRELSLRGFLSFVVIGPAVETLVLAAIAEVSLRVPRLKRGVPFLCAFCIAAVHAAVAPMWFFSTFWAFLVFAHAYLVWRRVGKGFVAAMTPHAAANLFAFALLCLDAGGWTA